MALNLFRRLWIVWIMFLLVGGVRSLHAQDHRALEKIVARLEARRESMASCRMPFTHERSSSLLLHPQTRDGVIYFDRAAGIAIHYQQPVSYALLISGENAYMLQSNTVERLSTAQEPMFNGLADFFHADFSMLEKHFDVTEIREKPPLITITFRPRRSMGLAELQMTVNEQRGVIERMIINESSGDKQEMVFGEPDFAPLDPALFTLGHWTSPDLARAYEPAPP